MSIFVHETAIVDDGVSIGEGTKIWHFCHVFTGAKIGICCSLGQNVMIADDVAIGDNVKIQNNVSVYAGVTVENDVFLGPSCVFTNISNPRSQVARRSLYERTLVRRGATVGANATIVCGSKLGRYCLVSAGAVVTKDIRDYELVMGVPARRAGWVSRHGHRLTFGDDGVARCPESGLSYRLELDSDSEKCVRCLDLDEESSLPDDLSVGRRPYRDF